MSSKKIKMVGECGLLGVKIETPSSAKQQRLKDSKYNVINSVYL